MPGKVCLRHQLISDSRSLYTERRLVLRQMTENGSNKFCYVLVARLDSVDNGGQRWLHGSGGLSVGKGTTHQRYRSGTALRKDTSLIYLTRNKPPKVYAEAV